MTSVSTAGVRTLTSEPQHVNHDSPHRGEGPAPRHPTVTCPGQPGVRPVTQRLCHVSVFPVDTGRPSASLWELLIRLQRKGAFLDWISRRDQHGPLASTCERESASLWRNLSLDSGGEVSQGFLSIGTPALRGASQNRPPEPWSHSPCKYR